MPFLWKDDKKKYQKEYHAKWYQKNKEKVAARKNEHIAKTREWFKNHKAQLCCSKCGFQHPAAIDFHHVEPDKKEHNLFSMVNSGFTIENIKKELEKCIPLCSNCHRILHFEENQ